MGECVEFCFVDENDDVDDDGDEFEGVDVKF